MELDQGSIKHDGFLVLALVFELQRHRLLVVLGGYSCCEDLTQRRRCPRLQRLWQIEREVLYQDSAHDLFSDSIVGMQYSPTHRATQLVAWLGPSCLDFFSIAVQAMILSCPGSELIQRKTRKARSCSRIENLFHMSILTYFRCNFNYPTVRTERDPTYSTFSGLVSRFENGRVSSLANDKEYERNIFMSQVSSSQIVTRFNSEPMRQKRLGTI